MANVFDPQHLQDASSDLVQSMFRIGRKAAELERSKLQSEIRKEESEIRRKQFEKRLVMAKREDGATKNPKPPQIDEEEEDKDLKELVDDPGTRKQKTPSLYSKLQTGEFITKGTDRRVRLDKRQKKRLLQQKQPNPEMMTMKMRRKLKNRDWSEKQRN